MGTHADDPEVKENEEIIIDSIINAAESKPYSNIIKKFFVVDNTTAGHNEEDSNYVCVREIIHSMGKKIGY